MPLACRSGYWGKVPSPQVMSSWIPSPALYYNSIVDWIFNAIAASIPSISHCNSWLWPHHHKYQADSLRQLPSTTIPTREQHHHKLDAAWPTAGSVRLWRLAYQSVSNSEHLANATQRQQLLSCKQTIKCASLKDNLPATCKQLWGSLWARWGQVRSSGSDNQQHSDSWFNNRNLEIIWIISFISIVTNFWSKYIYIESAHLNIWYVRRTSRWWSWDNYFMCCILPN